MPILCYDVTDPEQMAYQAGNPWLRPKPIWSRRRLYRADIIIIKLASCSQERIFGEWPRGALPGSSDLKFFSTFFWLGPMGLARGAGSVALPTSFGGKGPHLKQ